jgi:hypothetical protein
MPWLLLADAVLALHLLVVAFVAGGLLLVVAGNLGRRWPWVNHYPFRLAHLAAIAFVAVQAWLGATCPLTTLEMALRAQAGQAAYAGGFIAHWLQRLLYWDFAPWVFVLAYTLFGMAVLWAWWCFPPRRGGGTMRSFPGPKDKL